MKIIELVALIASVLLLSSIEARASGLRCKSGDIAQIGDSRATILGKCGEPMLKDSFCKPSNDAATPNSVNKEVANVVPCETVDEWTYNPGSGQFYTTLRFERGTLSSIKYGARVP